MQAFGAAIDLQELQAIATLSFLSGELAATGGAYWVFLAGGGG